MRARFHREWTQLQKRILERIKDPDTANLNAIDETVLYDFEMNARAGFFCCCGSLRHFNLGMLTSKTYISGACIPVSIIRTLSLTCVKVPLEALAVFMQKCPL